MDLIAPSCMTEDKFIKHKNSNSVEFPWIIWFCIKVVIQILYNWNCIHEALYSNTIQKLYSNYIFILSNCKTVITEMQYLLNVSLRNTVFQFQSLGSAFFVWSHHCQQLQASIFSTPSPVNESPFFLVITGESLIYHEFCGRCRARDMVSRI